MLSWLLLFTFATTAPAAEFVSIRTAKGTEIQVTFSRPAGKKLAPLVVFAPGQSCGERPFYDHVTDALHQRGLAVVRFQYAFCSRHPDGSELPSAGLTEEVEAFQAAHAYGASQTGVDGAQVAFLGKSLGSVVGYRAFQQERSASALALLTPVCTYTTDDAGKPLPEPQDVFAANYPKLGQEARPTLFLVGESDNLCLWPYMAKHLMEADFNTQAKLFPGDHGFGEKKADGTCDEEKTTSIQKQVAEYTAGYLARQFEAQE